jgi:hypothetical protein
MREPGTPPDRKRWEETMTITVDMNNRVGRLTFAAFAGAVLIGGSNFVAVKFSNLELAPCTALP